MIFASVPVIQPPEQCPEWKRWQGCGPELLIVDNTTDRAWEGLAGEQGWSHVGFGHNLGVCASWNVARSWFLAPRMTEDEWMHHFQLVDDLLFLFSASVDWTDGLAVVMHDLEQAANWKGCMTEWGGHGYAYSARVLREVGLWDENYFPGYYGDSDLWYRMILAGLICGGDDAIPQIETRSPKPEDGRALRELGIVSHTPECLAYFKAKWGGQPSEEQYDSPFDSGLPTSWWSSAYRPGLEHVDPMRTEYRW